MNVLWRHQHHVDIVRPGVRIALEHPNVPDGAVLRIPDEHDPSPVRRALIDLGVVEVPSVEALHPRTIPVALT